MPALQSSAYNIVSTHCKDWLQSNNIFKYLIYSLQESIGMLPSYCRRYESTYIHKMPDAMTNPYQANSDIVHAFHQLQAK